MVEHDGNQEMDWKKCKAQYQREPSPSGGQRIMKQPIKKDEEKQQTVQASLQAAVDA